MREEKRGSALRCWVAASISAVRCASISPPLRAVKYSPPLPGVCAWAAPATRLAAIHTTVLLVKVIVLPYPMLGR